MIKLIASQVSIDAAAGETGRREITGIAVPYGVAATVSDGTSVIFQPGSLPVDGKAPRLFMYHNASMPVGIVTERVDTPDGMLFTAKISASTQGQDCMIMLQETVIDQVSVGVNPRNFSYDENGTMIIESADWTELSLVPIGAFGDMANIATVAASIPQDEPEISTIETEPTQETETMSETTPVEAVEATIPTAPIFASAKREPRLPSAGEFTAAMFAGGEIAASAQRVFADYRAYHKSPIQAAAGDEVLSNVPGLIPAPILGPVFADINYIAPVLNALGTRAMPNGGAGSTFIRPTWTTHVSAAQQSTELTAVSATTGVIASNVVSKVTFAGQSTLSYQTVAFSDPALMEIIIQDLAGQYLLAIDNYAADNLLTAATSAGVWDLSVTDLMKSIYDAAVVTSQATNMLPTHIFVDPATWALMGQLVDTTGRPVFPAIGAPGLTGMNTLGAGSATSWSGMNPLGLEIVVDNQFAAKTMVIMNKNAFEVYRQDMGLLSVELPSTLGRNLSVYGFAATFKANAAMIQKITQA